MRSPLTVLVVAVLAAALLPAPAAAQTPLPVGESDGVRIVRPRGAIVVVFTKRADRLWRRVAGKRVGVYCEEHTGPDELGFGGVNEGGAVYRAPKRGRRIRTGDGTRGLDLCKVWLEARTLRRGGERIRYGRELLVTIPLSQKGAVRVDEQRRTQSMLGVLFTADLLARRRDLDRALTPSELIAALPRLRRPLRLDVVALASRDATPPAGAVGYYSDGAAHLAAVIVSASGRRLFIEYEPGGVLRTNVAEYIYE